MSAPSRTSFCIINCEDSVQWNSLPQLYQVAFGRHPESEDWALIETAKTGELPLGHYDVIFISGSHYNVEDSLPWMQSLCQFIREAVRPDRTAPYMVGCCFGAQIIAHALGGEVARNPNMRFALKLEELTPSPELAHLRGASFLVMQTPGAELDAVVASPDPTPPLCPESFLKVPSDLTDYDSSSAASLSTLLEEDLSSDVKCSLRGIASHGFCVSRLPPGAVHLASSTTCPHEIFAYGDRVVAFQCHPEFTLNVVSSILWPAVVERHKRLTAPEAEAARASFMKPTNNGALQAFIRSFCGLSPQ